MSFCRQNSFRLILLWYNSSIMANICACRASVFCIKYKLLAPKVDGGSKQVKMHHVEGIRTYSDVRGAPRKFLLVGPFTRLWGYIHNSNHSFVIITFLTSRTFSFVLINK